MRTTTAIVMVLCLCFCASFAAAQGDPGDGCQSGLDVFSPGMANADAQKLGAKPAGDNAMQATVTWGDKPWNVVLLSKGKEITVVSLSAKLTDNAAVTTLLKDMEERLAVPLLITRESNGEAAKTNMAKLAAQGKDAKTRHAVLLKALGSYAGQDNGSLSVLFCPSDMLDALVKETKTKGDIDDKAVMAAFADNMLYCLRMQKADGSIVVVVSTFGTIGGL